MDDAVKRAFRAIRSFDVPDDELGESLIEGERED